MVIESTDCDLIGRLYLCNVLINQNSQKHQNYFPRYFLIMELLWQDTRHFRHMGTKSQLFLSTLNRVIHGYPTCQEKMTILAQVDYCINPPYKENKHGKSPPVRFIFPKVSRKRFVLPYKKHDGDLFWYFTTHATIFQSYMWRHIDVQADWRRS